MTLQTDSLYLRIRLPKVSFSPLYRIIVTKRDWNGRFVSFVAIMDNGRTLKRLYGQLVLTTPPVVEPSNYDGIDDEDSLVAPSDGNSSSVVVSSETVESLSSTSVVELSDGDQATSNDIDRIPYCTNCGCDCVCNDVDADGVCRKCKTKRRCEACRCHLPDHCFPRDASMCEACSKRRNNSR